jgi:hypothetical protein
MNDMLCDEARVTSQRADESNKEQSLAIGCCDGRHQL